jgi:hypothetical protein
MPQDAFWGASDLVRTLEALLAVVGLTFPAAFRTHSRDHGDLETGDREAELAALAATKGTRHAF